MGDIINYTQPIRVLFSVRLVKSYFELYMYPSICYMYEYHHSGWCVSLVTHAMQYNALQSNAFIHSYIYFAIFRDFLQLGRMASKQAR